MDTIIYPMSEKIFIDIILSDYISKAYDEIHHHKLKIERPDFKSFNMCDIKELFNKYKEAEIEHEKYNKLMSALLDHKYHELVDIPEHLPTTQEISQKFKRLSTELNYTPEP